MFNFISNIFFLQANTNFVQSGSIDTDEKKNHEEYIPNLSYSIYNNEQ